MEKTGPQTQTSPGLFRVRGYTVQELGAKRQRSYEARGPGFVRDKEIRAGRIGERTVDPRQQNDS